MEPSKDQEPEIRALGRYLKYSHLGIQLCVSVGLPTGIGIWADRRLGTGVLLTLVGLALGFTAGLYSLYREVYPSRGPSGGPPGPGEGGSQGGRRGDKTR